MFSCATERHACVFFTACVFCKQGESVTAVQSIKVFDLLFTGQLNTGRFKRYNLFYDVICIDHWFCTAYVICIVVFSLPFTTDISFVLFPLPSHFFPLFNLLQSLRYNNFSFKMREVYLPGLLEFRQDKFTELFYYSLTCQTQSILKPSFVLFTSITFYPGCIKLQYLLFERQHLIENSHKKPLRLYYREQYKVATKSEDLEPRDKVKRNNFQRGMVEMFYLLQLELTSIRIPQCSCATEGKQDYSAKLIESPPAGGLLIMSCKSSHAGPPSNKGAELKAIEQMFGFFWVIKRLKRVKITSKYN